MCGIFVCLVPGFIVYLVSSFRYNGLATLALAAFGRVRALHVRCGPFGPAYWQTLSISISYMGQRQVANGSGIGIGIEHLHSHSIYLFQIN